MLPVKKIILIEMMLIDMLKIIFQTTAGLFIE